VAAEEVLCRPVVQTLDEILDIAADPSREFTSLLTKILVD
jgi:hypothetical protein